MKTEELEKELKELIDEGVESATDVTTDKREKFTLGYETWYSKALMYIKKINNDRVEDFKCLYKLEKRKEITYATYTISDALCGVGVPMRDIKPSSAFSKILQQVMILKSTKELLRSKVYELQELLQADIFDNELSSAKELNKKGFYRAAGAICGVILEEHFHNVLDKHNINISKKNPTINDYNDLLKNNAIIDVPTFRHIQLLGDIRNLCDHKKDENPTKEQIEDLIRGTDKIIKTIF